LKWIDRVLRKPYPKISIRGRSRGWNQTNCDGYGAKMNVVGGGAGGAAEPWKMCKIEREKRRRREGKNAIPLPLE
jgi:hypothetical protein